MLANQRGVCGPMSYGELGIPEATGAAQCQA